VGTRRDLGYGLHSSRDEVEAANVRAQGYLRSA
jgi:hypothetical protein